MMTDAYLLALHSINGLGPIRLKAVLDYFKDPKIAWEADTAEWVRGTIPKNVIELFLEKRKELNPIEYAESIQRDGIRWLTIFDPNYPKLLKQIYDPPIVLYYKGAILPTDENAVAVVGTRKITGYGKVVTEQFTKGLVRASLTIVSGLASGVDSWAHHTALVEKGRTIAVLGGGLNHIFPPENKQLAVKIASGFGAVVSEYAPNNLPQKGNFPIRNRIISGLSLAVLVTEAAEDSGSLITARSAIEQGREVFAVPGPVTSPLSKGPIKLINLGAKAVIEPQEILDDLQISAKLPVTSKLAHLSEEEKKVMAILKNETKHIDEIGRILNYPSAKISALLLRMEISGKVLNLGSGNYCKQS